LKAITNNFILFNFSGGYVCHSLAHQMGYYLEVLLIIVLII
jgi:hypothetical protein